MLFILVSVILTQGGQRTLKYCPLANVPLPAACILDGDPVDLNSGNYISSRTDLNLETPTGSLDFVRTFSSSPATWQYGDWNEMQGFPKPFGEPTGAGAMYWWHNWLSYIEVRPARTISIKIRLQGGRGIEWYTECHGGYLGWGPSSGPPDTQGPREIAEELSIKCPISPDYYETIDNQGRISKYADKLTTPDGGSVFYMLSSIGGSDGSESVAVHYGNPIDALGQLLTGCPRPDPNSWAPYVSYVQDVRSGVAFRLIYAKMTYGGETRCLVSKLQQGVGTVGGSIQFATIKEYAPTASGDLWSMDAGVTLGAVSQIAVTGAPAQLEERYSYSTSPFTFQVFGADDQARVTVSFSPVAASQWLLWTFRILNIHFGGIRWCIRRKTTGLTLR